MQAVQNRGCIVELPCRELKYPNGVVSEVCAMVYSINRHRFVHGRITADGVIQYALFPGQYILFVRSWHSEIKRARRLTAALVRLTSRCTITPIASRSIETHHENELWRFIVRWQAFDALPLPLRDFLRMVPRKAGKLMRIGEYNETQTRWLQLYIEQGIFKAYYTIHPL